MLQEKSHRVARLIITSPSHARDIFSPPHTGATCHGVQKTSDSLSDLRREESVRDCIHTLDSFVRATTMIRHPTTT